MSTFTNLNSMIFSVPGGPPGSLITQCPSFTETADLDYSLGSNLQFGTPLKALSSTGQLAAFQAGDATGLLYGFLVRYVPSASGGQNFSYNRGAQDSTYSASVLIAGSMRVVCVAGTPVRGQNVWMRNLPGSSLYQIGDLATSPVDSTFSVVPNVIWLTNGVDPQNIAILRIFPTTPILESGGEIGGYPVVLTDIQPGDMIMFTGTAFVNIPQSDITAGSVY